MVAITQRVEVCDICRAIDRPVTHYRVAPDGGRLRKIALCHEHAAPLSGLMESLSLWTSGNGRANRQVTMEQIEEVKRAQKRAARKKA